MSPVPLPRLLSIALCLAAALALPTCSQNSGDNRSANTKKLVPLRDVDHIHKNRVLRVLISPSKTNFIIHGDQPRGFEYEMLKEYEKHINRDKTRRDLHMTLLFIPVESQNLVARLAAGEGDIAAGMLTITPERSQKVAFTDPYLSDVNQVVVGNRGQAPINSDTDLAGRTFYVRRNSAYVSALKRFNQKLSAKNLRPVEIVEVDYLETEDILDLIQAGGPQLTVADDYLADIWAQVMPQLKPYPDLVLDQGGHIGWAVQLQDEALRADLNQFIAKHRKGTIIGNVLFQRYFADKQWISNPFEKIQEQDMQRYTRLFKKYGAQYDLDWRMIAALAYQESRFDHSMVSRRGAVGLMQIKASTAADPNVGIDDIQDVEGNVHAGVRYLAWIRGRYFDDEAIAAPVQVDFAMAAYNAGPARIQKLRRKAAKMGYDPNVWYGNVEKAALTSIGQEPVNYVVNIAKYYLMFRFHEEIMASRVSTKEALRDAD